MVTCPACEGTIDVDEEDVEEGDSLSCDECGATLKVISTGPLELESAEELKDEDEELLEEEEEEEEDWK
jgi:alpha-aminoadipate/glutamate carrier protein LysW